MMERLTPPPDGWIERVPEPPEHDAPGPILLPGWDACVDRDTDLCDSCRRSGVQIARTDFVGNTVCVECDEEGDE